MACRGERPTGCRLHLGAAGTEGAKNRVSRMQIMKEAPIAPAECIPRPMPKHLGFYMYGGTPKSQAQLARPKYRSGATKPQSSSDYYNLMWDPHVYRGETFRTFQQVERERYADIAKQKSKKTRKPRPVLFGGIERPKTPPNFGNRHARVPIEKFLEENLEPVQVVDGEAQTDLIQPKPQRDCPVVAKIGFDASTEMNIDDLYSFDEEVEPIVETLAEKVVEQSIIETTEEEALMLLRTWQNELNERRRVEQLEQYWKHIRERLVHKQQQELIQQLIQEVKEEQEVEDRVLTTQFSKSYLMDMIPKLLDSLENEGLISSAHLGEIFDSLQPWLTKEVLAKVDKKMMHRALLDEIIQGVVDNREAETANAPSSWGLDQPPESQKLNQDYLHPEYDE